MAEHEKGSASEVHVLFLADDDDRDVAPSSEEEEHEGDERGEGAQESDEDVAAVLVDDSALLLFLDKDLSCIPSRPPIRSRKTSTLRSTSLVKGMYCRIRVK